MNVGMWEFEHNPTWWLVKRGNAAGIKPDRFVTLERLAMHLESSRDGVDNVLPHGRKSLPHRGTGGEESDNVHLAGNLELGRTATGFRFLDVEGANVILK